jgi:glutaredoxin-like YruB-family protein
MPYTAPASTPVNITIYSTPTCGYCKMAKEYLKSKNIPFTDIDVSTDQKKAEEMISKSGQFGVPVIDVNGKLIIGFDKRKLDEYIAALNAKPSA